MNEDDIVRRYESLKSERSSVQDLWELISRFILPFRGEFYRDLNNEEELDWHVREVYDSTAVFAAQALAASMQGNLTSPSTLWFNLKFRDTKLNESSKAMEWLEEAAMRLFEALQDSNFNIEAAETYIDLVGYGTSVLVEEPESELEWQGINFQSIPIRECYFEEDHKGQVLNLYRKLKWTPLQIMDKWGEATPQFIKDKTLSPESCNTKMELVFCVFTRKDKKDADVSQPLAPKERPYGYKYVMVEGEHTILGEEGGYFEMPAFCPRWLKVSGSRWGHSPGAIAMGDILSLNQMKEAILESAGKVLDPTILVEEQGLMGDFMLERGSMNVVADIDRVRAFESGARFDVGDMQVSQLKASIEKAFYQDQLELKESPAMTATEVNVRYELMQRLLGPTLGRLQNDFLDPLIQRTFNIMYRAGALPELPTGIEMGQMDIEYVGPLARSQKSDTVIAIERWLANIAGVAEIFPEALDRVDIDMVAKEIATLSGVPAKMVRNDDEVAEVREQRAGQQQAQQELAMQEAEGNAGKALGEGAQAMQEGGIPLESEEDSEAVAGAAGP